MPNSRTRLTRHRNLLGSRLQQALDGFSTGVAERPLGAGLLGAGLALAVMIGGVAAFAVIWMLLVGVIH